MICEFITLYMAEGACIFVYIPINAYLSSGSSFRCTFTHLRDAPKVMSPIYFHGNYNRQGAKITPLDRTSFQQQINDKVVSNMRCSVPKNELLLFTIKVCFFVWERILCRMMTLYLYIKSVNICMYKKHSHTHL